MKKLLIIAAVICAAASSQASAAKWGSGVLYTASGKDGGWSSTAVNTADARVTMNLYLVDESTYAKVSAYDQKGMFDWSSTQSASYTGQNVNSATGATTSLITIQELNADPTTTYYAILTATYTDATYGDMYMAAARELTTGQAGTKSVNNIFGGLSTATTGGVRDWQPVPEPTSGLLLLLGMGALALRRKQK